MIQKFLKEIRRANNCPIRGHMIRFDSGNNANVRHPTQEKSITRLTKHPRRDSVPAAEAEVILNR